MNTLFKLVGVLALIIFFIAIGPLAVIWAWNTLFGATHEIPFTFWTWLAAAILMAVPQVRVKTAK